tara:strand:+ start:3588 stop:4385 length:798 start_codon:yes stop_codon:yes gene_type:complete
MIKKTILSLSALVLYSCAPNPPEVKGPESITFSIETIEEELRRDSLLQMRFYIEDLKIDTSYASSESLEGQIRSRLLENNLNSEGSYSTYTEMIKQMMEEYRTLNGENEINQSWELSQSVQVVLNANGLFGLQSSHASYTGGAHGNTFVSNQTYRLDNQNLLTLDSLLIPAKKQDFIAICESKFRQEQNLAPTESLEAKGFWFKDDRFYLPEIFSYSPAGLSLFYNSYEIAPYAYGIIEISLSQEEITPFLKGEYLLAAASTAAL